MKEKAILALADGTLFEGRSVGMPGTACGEVIFNTSHTGYQEILTDPSYTEQIIVFTQPEIGTVGVNAVDMESERMWASGAVMRHITEVPSNWRAEQSLPAFFKAQAKVAIDGLDTRALTLHLRQSHSMPGCVMAGDIDVKKALQLAKSWANMDGKNLAAQVTTPFSYTWTEGTVFPPQAIVSSQQYSVVVIDYGVKRSILQQLVNVGCHVQVVPAHLKATDILNLKPDGIVLSNGPGDPDACHQEIETIQALLVEQIPIFGICLGHQLLGLASGMKTEKMKFGHHGANHPIQCLKNQNVFISSQNHGFILRDADLPATIEVTHRSLFDGTIAGIKRIDTPAFSFQGHPEAGPGPTELTGLFQAFIDLIEVSHA